MKVYYNSTAKIISGEQLLFHERYNNPMSTVMKNPEQLKLMCYKVEIVLCIEAWYFLHGTTGGVCNLFYFLSLLSKMQTADAQVGKRGQLYTVKAGQADGSLLGLSKEWRIGRKAVRRLLDDFAERGIISVESNPLTSLISMVCVKSWLDGGQLIENSMFRSTIGKFEGVRIYLLNGQQFGVLRRSSQRSGSKSNGKGKAAAMDRCSVSEPTMQTAKSVSDTSTQADKQSLCGSEDMQADIGAGVLQSADNGTIRPPAESTTSGNTDADLL